MTQCDGSDPEVIVIEAHVANGCPAASRFCARAEVFDEIRLESGVRFNGLKIHKIEIQTGQKV